MFTIIQKELRQFFSGLLGYLTIGVFLLITGILLFIIPESGILDAGYASMDSFFAISPYIMLFLIPAITMKSFSDEYRNGTFEILKTSPLPIRDLVLGKFLAAMALVLITLLISWSPISVRSSLPIQNVLHRIINVISFS
jgi:ABC-2 type transport system permease protein